MSFAGAGDEALLMANEKRPDLILLDMMLPKMSGLEILQALKKAPATATIAVVVLTGHSRTNAERLLRDGAIAFLGKADLALDQGAEPLLEALNIIAAKLSAVSRAHAERRRAAMMPKILVVDDFPLYAHLLSRWLQDRGFEVVVASNAIQAFVVATQYRPDAVILDISMFGGIDILKKLKLSTKTKHIPVLVITGNAGSEMRGHVECLGTANLPEKPLDCAELCTILSGLTVEADSSSIATTAR
jgi:CheY-like chemotaxis protein